MLKKFRWRLQKILDIKLMQENALKAELANLTQEEVGLRSQILLLNTQMNSMVSDLKSLPLNERLFRQSATMSYSDTVKYKGRIIQKKIKAVIEKKEKKKSEILETRKLRKGLEKLREKAKEEFIKEQEKILQDELDECASIATARKMIFASEAQFA